MSDSPAAATLPRAILYTWVATCQLPAACSLKPSWPTSVWSTVPQLCLLEKGYSEDEYVIKHVDISESHVQGLMR